MPPSKNVPPQPGATPEPRKKGASSSGIKKGVSSSQKSKNKRDEEQKTDELTTTKQHQLGIWSIGSFGVILAVALSGFNAYHLSRQQELRKMHLLSSASVSSTNEQDVASVLKENEAMGEEEKECTVWIAPSSLVGVNGFGVYTTRDIAEGESILGAPDGTGIIVGQYGYSEEPKARERRLWKKVFDNYWWGRGVPDHVAYDSTPAVVDFQIGFGCLPNHHCVLDYLSAEYPDPPYDDTLADRYRDQSAGSFSYNRGREFRVSHALRAGEEIFLNYGHCERSAGSPDWTKNAYVTEDFHHAAAAITQYQRNGRVIDYDEEGSLVVPQGMSDLVAELIPKNKTELDKLTYGITDHEELIRQIALNSLNQRTPEWIKANGMCMDNLIAKKSTIPLAGQGGFSQRTIRKGELVAPAFLMQIMDKDALILYDDEENPSGMQLLLNYCFGHTESTMLLCPNTNAVLINHCSVRTKDCGPDGPNAEYRWSSGWDPASDNWRKMTIDEIADQTGRGLTFEIVALRDIKPGEEVTMDYGEEWEMAWAKHVASWQPPTPPASVPWITAKEANEKEGLILDEFVSGDVRKTVDHPYLFTGCQYRLSRLDYHPVYLEDNFDWENLIISDEEILDRFSDPFEMMEWDSDDSYSNHGDGAFWPCSVIQQEDEDGFYTVRIHNSRYEEPPWYENDFPRLLTHFPRELIHYFVKPFASDQHLPGVFREPIGIRDEIFPRAWKNAKQNSK